MPRSAMEGTRLARLVRMAIPLCMAAERSFRQSGPGAPPIYARWQIAVLVLVAILARRKSKSAQYRYLFERRKALTNWIGLRGFPSRTTCFDRYRHAYELFQAGVIEQGRQAIREGLEHLPLMCSGISASSEESAAVVGGDRAHGVAHGVGVRITSARRKAFP